MVYSSRLAKQDGGKTCQKTKIGTGSTSTGTAFLVSENHTGDVHVSADSRGSPAVKSNADKGEPNSHGSIEIISEELTLKDLKDYLRLGKNAYLHLDGTTTKESISVRIDLKSVSPTVIEGEACQTTDESSLGAKSNTHQDDGSTASSQEGQGVSSQKLKIGIAGPESNTHLDDGSTLTDKGFLVSENNTCHVGLLSTTADGMLMGTDSCSSPAVKSKAGKGEACQTTDEFSLDSESNTHQDDGSTGRYRKGKGEIYQITYVDDGSTASPVLLGGFQDGKAFLRKFDGFQEVTTSEVVKDSGWADPQSNTHKDDGSTAAAAVLGGGFTTTTEGEGVSSQKIKIGIAGSDNNTHLDDGSTWTDKGFMVSENNTCHVDLSTTADGMLWQTPGEPDSHGSPAEISKDWEGDSHDPEPEISQEVILEARKEKMFTVASSCDSDAVKPNAGKGITISVPDYFGSKVLISNDGKGTRIVVPDYHRSKVVISTDSKDEPDPQARIFTELISNDCKGGNTYRHLERNTDVRYYYERDPFGPTTKEAISLLDDLSVTGKEETPQITDVPCLDSESNTPQEDADSQEVQGSSMESLPSDIVQESVPVEDGPYPATVIQQLQFRRNTYLQLQMDLSERDTDRYDGLTTKESISVRNDLKSVSPTVIPVSDEDETPQRTDVPCLDSESNTPREDADSQEVQGSSMESLPTDIVQDILSRVPAEFVLGCKLVCKKWVTLIGGNRFANMHLTRQLNHFYHGDEGEDKVAANVDPCLFFACRTDDPDEFISLLFHGGQPSDRISRGEKYIYNQNLKRIYHPPMHNEPLFDHLVGSCNGLVCAFQHHHLVIDPIYICNPLTREYVYLPQLVVKKEDTYLDNPNRVEGGEVDMLNYTACGFGYVRSTNEYKVVRVHYLDSMEGNVEVYTLGSGCGWRAKGEVPYRLDTSSGGMGTYANDAIYWISDKTVVAFDLADEEFRALSSVPPRLENCRHGGDRIGLVALGRHLCLYIDDELRVEIWSLMKSRNSKETWRMEFDIDYQVIPGTCDRELQPILLTKSGEIIFLYSRSVLYSYDPKTTVLNMISNEASTDNFEAMEAIAHVNTFASLGAMGENSKRYTVCTPLDDFVGDLERVALGEGIDATRFRLQ